MEDFGGYLLTAGVVLAGLVITGRVVRRILAGRTNRPARTLGAVVALGLGLFGTAFLAFWTFALTTKFFWLA
jgi:hypothetical protein